MTRFASKAVKWSQFIAAPVGARVLASIMRPLRRRPGREL